MRKDKVIISGKNIIIVLLVVAIVIVSIFLIEKSTRLSNVQKTPAPVEVPEQTMSVTLFFAGRDASGLLSETREIAVREGIEEQVKGVIRALAQGPEDDKMISALPQGTDVIEVFWVEESQTVYVDFNRVFISGHPGGGVSEYYTISMILRTISSNFPQIRKLQFLVDGYPVETIAGHYDTTGPLDLLNWR
ncbi:MAG: GerMN domain-containing protein [Candidatus Krumholzibacteriota bacterium]|nr:GerMN domain-containing protein [Candidatus Krumholzibacteriota bacterium]